MITKDEALKMAIKALLYGTDHTNAVKACKEALEQPTEQQKAFMDEVKYGQSFMIDGNHVPIDSFNK
jgi:hypothetical protein